MAIRIEGVLKRAADGDFSAVAGLLAEAELATPENAVAAIKERLAVSPRWVMVAGGLQVPIAHCAIGAFRALSGTPKDGQSITAVMEAWPRTGGEVARSLKPAG